MGSCVRILAGALFLIIFPNFFPEFFFHFWLGYKGLNPNIFVGYGIVPAQILHTGSIQTVFYSGILYFCYRSEILEGPKPQNIRGPRR